MYRFGWRGSRDFTAFIPLLYSIVLVQAGHERGLFPLIVESEHADMVGGARASDTRGHVGRVSGPVLAVLRSKGAGCGGCRVPEGGPGSVAVLQPGLVTAPGVLGRGAASTRRSSHRQSRPGTQEPVITILSNLGSCNSPEVGPRLLQLGGGPGQPLGPRDAAAQLPLGPGAWRPQPRHGARPQQPRARPGRTEAAHWSCNVASVYTLNLKTLVNIVR